MEYDLQLTNISKEIADRLIDTRNRELELMSGLTNEQLLGSRMRIVEPPLWELGHVGWFQDKWILQHLDGLEPADINADPLYNSFKVTNEERWELNLPSLGQTIEYITDILHGIIRRLEGKSPTEKEIYFYNLVLNHEEMHIETMHHIRHTYSYPAPNLKTDPINMEIFLPCLDFEPHDISIPGGVYNLGGLKDYPFVFDNEKWSHPVEIEPFNISSTPVTFGDFQAFVDYGGYKDKSFWDDEGWEWRSKDNTSQPAYWKKDTSGHWLWRWFDQWLPFESHLPMINVNWYEAMAYCRWANLRLPSEAEWELAASGSPGQDREGVIYEKRQYPWGRDFPSVHHANLNSSVGCIIDVRALPGSDSAFGLRQMIGNVWEWTQDTFNPYPGYIIDPYDTYSEPSFGQQKVLKGGSWATRPHVIRNTFRNFYTPDRNNIFAGFRTAKSLWQK